MGTGAQPTLWERLGDLRLPTLLLCGEQDAKFCGINAEMQMLIPDAELVIVPDAGHTIHAEQPERFRGEVMRFLGIGGGSALE
jgi:2-succinyl-6-hydroxy-2,4-cyclohexadiene-1-carboxylate synthase